MADYLALLGELSELDPPAFVFGSVAEGVLLDGVVPPTAGDVDLLVPRAGLAARIEELTALGFEGFEVFYEPRPGLPMVFGASRAGAAIEVTVVDHDDAGQPFFALQSGEQVVSISITAAVFDWPPSMVEGVCVHTLSPLALHQMRAGLMITRAFGDPRDHDLVRQERLRATFFPERSDADLAPTISRLEAP